MFNKYVTKLINQILENFKITSLKYKTIFNDILYINKI